MKKINLKFTFTIVLILFGTYCPASDIIVWSTEVKVNSSLIILDDKSEDGKFNINRIRNFLYDSLENVSTQIGSSFNERTYSFKFKEITDANTIVIPFPEATQLIYYIKLKGDGYEQIVYRYGATPLCDSDKKVFVLSIPKISHPINEAEISTFLVKGGIPNIGIAKSLDVLDKLNMDYCYQSSFFGLVKQLDGGVNSNNIEVKPIISTDGRTLIFHRQNAPSNLGGIKDEQDIYISEINIDGNWKEGTNIGQPLNNKGSNGITSVMPGDGRVYLLNEYRKDKTSMGLSYSDRTLDGWTYPKPVIMEDFINYSKFFDYCVSANQMVMILALDDGNSFGDQDLYVSKFNIESNTWSKPLNLGSEINSPWAEAAPFLAADGKTLFFASDGHLGYGGFDLFVSERLDDTWLNWSTPANIGPLINDENDNLYYTISAKADKAYFSSSINGVRNILEIALPNLYKPKPAVLLNLEFFDLESEKSITQNVKIRSLTNQDFMINSQFEVISQKQSVVLPLDDEYEIELVSTEFHNLKLIYSTRLIDQFKEISLAIPLLKKSISFPFETTKDSVIGKQIPLFYTVQKENEQYSDLIKITGIKEIAENYIVEKNNTEGEVSLLYKGQLIDASTFKPIPSSVIIKLNNEVKSRAVGNPITGVFQAVLFDNTYYDVDLYLEDKRKIQQQIKTPKLNGFEEIEGKLVIGAKPGESIALTLGLGYYKNINKKKQRKIEREILKRKYGKSVLKTFRNVSTLPYQLQQDIEYIADILSHYPNWKANVTILSSLPIKEGHILAHHIGKEIGIFDRSEGNVYLKPEKPNKKEKKSPKGFKILVNITFEEHLEPHNQK